MHKGRGGRRHWLQYLSLDADPPFFMPYWIRPEAFFFLYFGFPVTGPLAAAYQSPVMPTPTSFHWEDTWNDPIVMHNFRWTFDVSVRFPLQGTELSWSLDDLAGNFVGGTVAINFMQTWWSPKHQAYPTTSPPNPLLFLTAVGGPYYEWANWREKP